MPFPSEDLIEVKGLSSGWLPFFSDLQVEPQYLSLDFYYLCYNILVPYDLPKINQNEINNVNRSIVSNEVNIVIKIT